MNFRIIFFIKRKILDRLHNITLAKMNHSFNVINQTLVLYLSWLIDCLLDFDRILVDFSAQFGSHLYLYMSLCDIILKNKEHRFIWLK